MAKRLKRAFTIVELVIVIAVIAILAAVLIPTFTTLIDKANESNDIALVKNLNTALVSKEATDEVNTMQDALDAAYEYGYTVDKLTPSSSGDIVWDEVNNRFALINEKKEVVFEDGAKPLTSDKAKIWKIVTELAGTQDYSWYVGGLSKEAIEKFTFTMGVDTGSVEADVNYVTAAEQDVTIRTAGGTLTVNAKNATVSHYDTAQSVDVQAVAGESYHEYGKVTGNLTITKGHVVFESTAVVNTFVVSDEATAVKATVNDKAQVLTAVAKDNNILTGLNLPATVETVVAEMDDLAMFAGGAGTEKSPYQLTTATNVANINNLSDKMKSGESYYFEMQNDIDISTIQGDITTYISGQFDGNNYTLKIDQQWISSFTNKDFTLKDINIQRGTNKAMPLFAFLNYDYFGDGLIPGVVTFDNVDMTLTNEAETVELDSYGYSLYTMRACGSVIFKNCDNYVNYSIPSPGYAGVFIGNFIDTTIPSMFVFENCTNNGMITGTDVGFLFGNLSGIQGVNVVNNIDYNNQNNYVPAFYLENCVNNGTIIGTNSAAVFPTEIGKSNTTVSESVTSANASLTDAQMMSSSIIVSKINATLSVEGNQLVIVPPVSDSDLVNQYEVTYSVSTSFVDAQGNGAGSFYFVVSQYISSTDAATAKLDFVTEIITSSQYGEDKYKQEAATGEHEDIYGNKYIIVSKEDGTKMVVVNEASLGEVYGNGAVLNYIGNTPSYRIISKDSVGNNIGVTIYNPNELA